MVVISRKNVIISSLIIGGVVMILYKIINNNKKVEIPVNHTKEIPIGDVKGVLYIEVDVMDTIYEDLVQYIDEGTDVDSDADEEDAIMIMSKS
jgi:hypothetical protein